MSYVIRSQPLGSYFTIFTVIYSTLPVHLEHGARGLEAGTFVFIRELVPPQQWINDQSGPTIKLEH